MKHGNLSYLQVCGVEIDCSALRGMPDEAGWDDSPKKGTCRRLTHMAG
jgi:hypothetical protein